MSSKNNPFLIVNNLLKKYPNQDLVKSNLTVDHINSILSLAISGFEITSDQFNLLIGIEPLRLNLPIHPDEFTKVLGKPVNNHKMGIPGVYVFTNKETGCRYVGSSVSLSHRLRSGYFGILKGKRAIELAILEAGLDNFYLDVYLLPVNKMQDEAPNKLNFSNLVLALEQIFILLYNPEYNMLKVAGSSFGRILTVEQKAVNLNHLNKLNSSSQQKERLSKYNQLKTIKVLVLDIVTGGTTAYASLSEAAQTIGINVGLIGDALKVLKEKRIKRLIKGRYYVTTESLKDLKTINSSEIRRVNVLDILTNETTIYSSVKEVALALTCSEGGIYTTLSRSNNQGVTKLIKKRYAVSYASQIEDSSADSIKR